MKTDEENKYRKIIKEVSLIIVLVLMMGGTFLYLYGLFLKKDYIRSWGGIAVSLGFIGTIILAQFEHKYIDSIIDGIGNGLFIAFIALMILAMINFRYSTNLESSYALVFLSVLSLFFSILFKSVKISETYRKNRNGKNNIIFFASSMLSTIFMMMFTFLNWWYPTYRDLPRIYTPGFECPEKINVDNNTFSVVFSVGNYGSIPASWKYNITWDVRCLNLTSPKKANSSIIVVPIRYSKDFEQTKLNLTFKILNTNCDDYSFSFMYLIYGHDPIQLFFLNKNLYNKINCTYKLVNNSLIYQAK